MRILSVILACLTILLLSKTATAEMSSTNYKILWDSVGQGGSDTSSSANYELRDSIGGDAIGRSTSTSYVLDSGYRAGIFDQIITFEIFVQGSTYSPASALVGNTVTVSVPAYFSVGNKVAIIQDNETSHVVGVGEISGISGNDIIIDAIKTGGAVLTIDGTDDYVYLMGDYAINFGNIETTELAQSVVGWEVSIDLDRGYNVSVIEDGNLRLGSEDIDDVVDGSVTAGSEEYGGRSSDSTLTGSTFDTQDTAFTVSHQSLDTEPDTAFSSRDFLTLKAARGTGTTSGTYSHALSLIASGNY